MMAAKPIWARVRDGEVTVTPQKLQLVQDAIDRFIDGSKPYTGLPDPATGLALLRHGRHGKTASWKFVAQTRLEDGQQHQISDIIGLPTKIGEYPEMDKEEAIKIRDQYCLAYAAKLGAAESPEEFERKLAETADRLAARCADREEQGPETPPPLVGPELPRNFLERLTALMPVLPLMPERTQKGLVDALVHAEDSRAEG